MLLNLTQPGNKFMMAAVSKALNLMIYFPYTLFNAQRSNS